MACKLGGALLVVLLFGGSVLARDYSGTYERSDAERMTLTVKVDGKELTFRAADDILFYNENGVEIGKGIKNAKNLFKAGQKVVLTTEIRNGQTLATKLQKR